jgi:hypothetical protein
MIETSALIWPKGSDENMLADFNAIEPVLCATSISKKPAALPLAQILSTYSMLDYLPTITTRTTSRGQLLWSKYRPTMLVRSTERENIHVLISRPRTATPWY